MSSECSSGVETRMDDIRKRYANGKYKAYMKAHAAWWRILWITRLAIPYSRFMCGHNLYRKFPDGRCQYCGNNH